MKKIKKSAFTLIELLVVIVIIGILATFSVAQFNDYQERARFAKAVAFASQIDHVLMAETATTGYGFPLRLDFDEGTGTVAYDSSGSGNDTVDWSGRNITWITDTPDNSASAVALRNAQINSNNVKNMPEDEISFSAFVRMDQLPTTGGTFPLFVVSNSGFRIHPNGDAEFYINNGISDINAAANVIKIGRWHHLLGTYKNGKIRFFIDGNLIGAADATLTLPFNIRGNTGASTSQLFVGYTSTGQEFYGDIDRVRIYPVGLDPDNL